MLSARYLAALAAGIFFVAWWPSLPPLTWPLLAVGLSLAAAYWWRRLWVLAVFAIGVFYATVCGHQLLTMQLPVAVDRQDFVVNGYISGIPETHKDHLRFYFIATEIEGDVVKGDVVKGDVVKGDAVKGEMVPLPAKLRLSWYQRPFPKLAPQQQWRITVRLRRPRGTLNPGGFDYQRWLLRQGVAATGYVRGSDQLYLGERQGFSVDRWRYDIRMAIGRLAFPEPVLGLLTALTIGDRQLIDGDDWEAYSGLGLAHLLVISGLHVGLVALLGGVLAGLLARLAALYFVGITAQYWSAVGAIIAAAVYSCLASWSIPTQRAFVMVAVAAAMVLLNRSHQRALGFFLALAIVALLDPLAIWSAGFWLSFAAVAILLWLVPARRDGEASPIERWLLYPVKVQLVISLALMPLLLLLGLPMSPFMPLVNFFAIPWVSLLIVPLCLAGTLALPFLPELAALLWHGAGLQLQWFAQLARGTYQVAPVFAQVLPSPGVLPLFILMAGILLLLLPHGRLVRLSGVLLIAAAWLQQSEEPPLRITVLDVGQGLAVVVRTPGRTLVYDSGPFYSDRFDAGSGIVAPYLRRLGVDKIDTLLISHSDNDHAGGARPLLETLTADRVIVEPLMTTWLETRRWRAEPCLEGLSWNWGGVGFRVLAPQRPYAETDNDRSCVLQISMGNNRILLPGDIGKAVERQLQPSLPEAPLTLLVAPHHGSKTSSSRAFITALQPRHVVFSSGYRHHFGHPHRRVVNRYREAGATLWNTADSGALEFVWQHDGELTILPERERVRRFWHW